MIKERVKEMLEEQRLHTVEKLLELFTKDHVAMSCLEDEGPISIRLDQKTGLPEIEFTETTHSGEVPDPVEK